MLYLSVAVLFILLAGIRLPIALHVAVALRVRGTIPVAALAARPLARLLILIAALSSALVLILLFICFPVQTRSSDSGFSGRP
jgi:hypothetical protein